MNFKDKLSPRERALYDLLEPADVIGVDIRTLWREVNPNRNAAGRTVRNMQSNIASSIGRINQKLEREGLEGRVVPGDWKQTYRLTKRA